MNYLQNLYNLLENASELRSGCIGVYLDGISDVIGKYADPQYDKLYICNLVSDITTSLVEAAELHGFKQGLRHALKLVIETQHTPVNSGHEAFKELDNLLKSMLEQSKAAQNG